RSARAPPPRLRHADGDDLRGRDALPRPVGLPHRPVRGGDRRTAAGLKLDSAHAESGWMDSRAESVLPAETGVGLPWTARLERDGLVLASFAVFAGALVLRLVGQVNADGWLALVAGRWIARHGIPHHDTLTIW